ncbi:hypothetical protein HZS_1331, partial [Henneguya salminicola]
FNQNAIINNFKFNRFITYDKKEISNDYIETSFPDSLTLLPEKYTSLNINDSLLDLKLIIHTEYYAQDFNVDFCKNLQNPTNCSNNLKRFCKKRFLSDSLDCNKKLQHVGFIYCKYQGSTLKKDPLNDSNKKYECRCLENFFGNKCQRKRYCRNCVANNCKEKNVCTKCRRGFDEQTC